MSTARLLVESFILLEPWWTLATASVPFRMVFNKAPSLAGIQHYLDTREASDEGQNGSATQQDRPEPEPS